MNPSRSEIRLPPLHEIFSYEGSKDADEFVNRLRRMGFSVFCSLDATYIGGSQLLPYREEYRTAREASSYALDCRAPLIDKCVQEVMKEINTACECYLFTLTTSTLLKFPEDVHVEAIVFLSNQGYKVSKHFLSGRGTFESELWGHRISWDQGKFIRDIEVVPWWRRFWRKK